MNKAQQMLAKAGFPDTAAGRAAFHKQYPTPESFFQVHGDQDNDMKSEPDMDSDDMYKSGGSIHIKPSHKGRFTAYKQRTGKTTAEALHSKDPHVRQMANFARNAAKWKHQDGGPVMYAAGSMVSDPPPYTEEEALMNARLSGQYYDRFPKKNPGFNNGPGTFWNYMDRLKNRKVHYANPHQGVKDAPVNMHTITGSCESGTCYEFGEGGLVDAYQLMGMPTPPMYGYGSQVTDYTPSFDFGHVQSKNNTHIHGYGYGGPIGKYDFGSTIKTIGAAAYGAGEGLLDTVTMGATDQLTDAGYDALQKAGGSSESEIHKQNAWHGGLQTAGAVTGAVLNPGSIGSAITEGTEGVGEVIGEANPNSEKAQKWRQGITTVGGIAGMATGMGAFGAPGGGAAGMAKSANFQASDFGKFAGNAAKVGQGYNAISSGDPMQMFSTFTGMGGMGNMGGGMNAGNSNINTGSNFSSNASLASPNRYMNQGINFNSTAPSFGYHAMGGAVNAPNMMQYADGGLLGMGGLNKFSGLSSGNGLLGMGGVNKFSNMFADGGFTDKLGIAAMGLAPALISGKLKFADGGFTDKLGVAAMGLAPALISGKLKFDNGGFTDKLGIAAMGFAPALISGKLKFDGGGLLGMGGVNKFSGLTKGNGLLGMGGTNKFSGLFADGGETSTENLSPKDQYNLFLKAKPVTKYFSNAQVPHPADGSMDPRGTVTGSVDPQTGEPIEINIERNEANWKLPNNQNFITRKKDTEKILTMKKNGDKIGMATALWNTKFEKDKKEAKEKAQQAMAQQTMMAKYGGMVRKYDGGSNIPPIDSLMSGAPSYNNYNLGPIMGEGFYNPEAALNEYQNLENINNDNYFDFSSTMNPAANPINSMLAAVKGDYSYGVNTPQPTSLLSPQLTPINNPNAVPYRMDRGENWGYQAPTYNVNNLTSALRTTGATTNNNPYANYTVPGATNNTNFTRVEGAGGEEVPTGQDGTPNPSWFARNKGDLKTAGGKALLYGPGLYNLGRGIFEKAYQMNPEDYQVKSKLDAYEEQYRPDYRAYNAAMYAMRKTPGSGSLAGITNLYNAGQKGFADERYRVNQANAARKMAKDQFNIGLEGQNLSTKLNIDQFNQQQKAAKHNMLAQGLTDLSSGYQFEKNNQLSNNAIGSIMQHYDINPDGTITPKAGSRFNFNNQPTTSSSSYDPNLVSPNRYINQGIGLRANNRPFPSFKTINPDEFNLFNR